MPADAALGPPRDPEEDLPRMTLGQHLDELRRRVVGAVLALVVATIVAFVFHHAIFDVAVAPYRAAIRDLGGEGKLQSMGPLDAFTQTFKLAFIVGAVAVSPYVLWQMWGFVAAGLYPHEKRNVRVFFPVSVALFAAGCAVVWKLILPIGIKFLMRFGQNLGVTTNYAIEPYLSLCLTLLFGMGLAFQLPLVMLFLQATSIVSRATFAKGWRIAIFSAFVISMILTPDPTPVSQVLMATPLVGLYFLGVWGGRFVGPRRDRLTLARSWPLLLTIAILVALFVWGRQAADVIVLRAFATDAYAYPRAAADPAADLARLVEEMILADLTLVQGRAEKLRDNVKKRAKSLEQDQRELATIDRILPRLEAGKGVQDLEVAPEDDRRIRGFQLFSRKPYLLLVNGGGDVPAGLGDALGYPLREKIALDAMLAAELSAMAPEDRPSFMAEFGIDAPASERVVHAIYQAVGLRSFFTVGEDEVRAWTVRAGDDAVTAASKIHSDLAKGFVRAEVTAYDEIVKAGGLKESKGAMRLEGKDYVVKDGDIVHVRSSV